MFERVFAIRAARAFGAAAILTGCAGGPSPAPPAFPVRAPSAESNIQRVRVRYSISILAGIGGTSWTSADGINNRGWITGWSTLSGSTNPEHEMLWIGRRKFDFGTLGGPSSASEFAKKGNTNDVPGESETSIKDPLGEDFCYFGTGFTCLGTDWRGGDLDPLPTLGGNNGIAIGNNDRGQIVGVAETDHKDPNCIAPQVLDFEAVVWEPRSHRPKELPRLPGDIIGVATAINDRGEIAGGSAPTCATLTPALGAHPLLWKDGSTIQLPTLGGTMNNIPWMINQRGEMAGQANISGDATTHAVFWPNPNKIEDLGTLPGDFSSVGGSINDKDQVVGQSCDASGTCRGFIWQDGVMTDINTLITGSSRYYVVTANDINDSGIIVGAALDKKTGETLAFMATPHEANGTVTIASPKVALPKAVRDQLGKHRFGRSGRMAPAAIKSSKLYATGFDGSKTSINIFTVPGYRQIGSITDGISSPSDLWVDGNGDLYVSNNGDVTEYAPGGYSPICRYQTRYLPHYVTTDSADNVYITSTGPGYDPHTSYIDKFKQCGADVKQYSLPGEQPFVFAAGIAVDADANIFVAVGKGFVEFKKGESNPINLGAQASWLPGQLLIDKNKTLIAADSFLGNQGAIYTIPPPYGSAHVLASGLGPVTLTLNRPETLLFAGNQSDAPYIAVYKYPSGKFVMGLRISTRSPGLALSPDAPLP